MRRKTFNSSQEYSRNAEKHLHSLPLPNVCPHFVFLKFQIFTPPSYQLLTPNCIQLPPLCFHLDVCEVKSESVRHSVMSDSLRLYRPGSSVHGILQARILEWVVIPFSRGFSQPRDQTGSLALQADSLPSEPPWSPLGYLVDILHSV